MNPGFRTILTAPRRAWGSYRSQNAWYQFATIWSLVFLGWLTYRSLQVLGG